MQDDKCTQTGVGLGFRWESIFNDVPSAVGADDVRVERYGVNTP